MLNLLIDVLRVVWHAMQVSDALVYLCSNAKLCKQIIFIFLKSAILAIKTSANSRELD